MKLAYRFTCLLLLVGFLVTTTDATADRISKQEFSKTVKKEFDITSDGTTILHNKYGKIDVQTWTKNRVKVDVTITVRANTESEAQEVFERVSIDFSNGMDFVKAQTEIAAQQKSSWWGWEENKSDFSINYEVFMPATNSVEVSNKYGDTQIAAIEGAANLSLKYGNFNAESFGGATKIDFAYGNGKVNKSENVTSDIKYARMEFQEVAQMEMMSKYSNITIAQANKIRSNTKYDTYSIGKVEAFQNMGKYDNLNIDYAEDVIIDSDYTEVNIAKVGNSIDLELEYGGANIDQITRGFSDVRLVGSFADFKVNVEDGANYRMEATANYAGIRYPENLNVTYEKERGTYHEVEGHAGEKNARSFIKARLDYGGLKVRNN